jgi:hypothetical protein
MMWASRFARSVCEYAPAAREDTQTTKAMKKRTSLLPFLAAAIVLFITGNVFAQQCGVERWSVKTGTDPDAGLVNINSATATTIASLTSLTPPNPLPDNNRVPPTETTVWRLNATLKEFILEGDSDYALILSDDAGRTMLAEIPLPTCVGAGSPFAAGIAHARAQFDAVYTPTTSFQPANVPVQITGVGFFDFLEGQAGVATNGIELHPVLDIVFLPTNDFAISSFPSALTIMQGSSGSSTISTAISGSFNSAVSLSASGLPAGATATFNPPSIAAPGAGLSNLTISADSTTPVGTYNVVVTGSGGGNTHTTTIGVTINNGSGTTQQLVGNPGFENGSSSPAPWVTSAGVIDSNITLEPAHTGSWKAWLNGYGVAHTDSLSQQVSIPATAVSATLSFWLHIDSNETTNTQAFDTLSVQIRNSAGTTLTTLATYSNLNKAPGYSQVSFDLSSYKGQTIQIYLLGVEDATLQTSFVVDDFALNANISGGSTADFAISSSPASVTIAQGSSGASTISTTISGGFNSAVSLSASGLPSGVTASFSPSSIAAPGAGSATMTISANATAALGTFTVVVTGSGGAQTHVTTINLTVNSGGGTTSQQLLGNPGFENGASTPAPWVAAPTVIDSSTFETAHTGTWKAWLGGYGIAHTDTLYQQVSIPSTAISATLSFWLHIDTTETATTAKDTLALQVRDSSGVVLANIASYSNLDAATGFSQVAFNLTSYKGQTIQIYLLEVEDSVNETSFVVDDFALDATISSGGPVADFAISSSPAALTISQGNSGTATITTTVSGGFNSSVSLSASGLPAGASASFNPSSISAPGAGTSTMTISVGSSTVAGTYSVVVTGTGGGQTHTTTIGLTIANGGSGTTQQLLGNTGFENGSSNPAPWTASTGVISNSTYEAAHSGSWKAWLDGYGSAHTDTLYQSVSIPSNATSASLSFWLHIDTVETTTSAANDKLAVQIRNSSGTVLATLATYSNLNAASGYTQASFDVSSYKGQTIQVYLIGTENSTLRTSFVVDDFALNATVPSSGGGTTSELVTNNGFEGTLSPWVLGGAKVPVVWTARAHSGSSSMSLGASGGKEPNGDSSAYQTVTIPANVTAASLTFWYSTASNSTFQKSWQEAWIRDSSGANLLQVFKFLQNTATWTQKTVDLKPYAGKTIRIYFNCHGDGSDHQTNLWIDDVSVKVTN